MATVQSSVNRITLAPVLDAPLVPGLLLLRQAHSHAIQFHCHASATAIEQSTLRLAGVGPEYLQWMVSQGFLQETTYPADSCDGTTIAIRSESKRLRVSKTCWYLSEAGFAWIADFLLQISFLLDVVPSDFNRDRAQETHHVMRPHWDARQRRLWMNGVIVREFHRPAPNQEAILAAFEGQVWPHCILDPLPPTWGKNVKKHLNETIDNLNASLTVRLIQFRGDGTGRGVCWTEVT